MRIYALLVTALLAGTACASSTPVTDAPLPVEEQRELGCTLLGTWNLESIDGEKMMMADLSWVFRSDGTGVYVQRKGQGLGAAAVYTGDNAFEWRLEGRNIFLELSQGEDGLTVYRADAFTDANMRWFNYRLSDNYALVRTAYAEKGCDVLIPAESEENTEPEPAADPSPDAEATEPTEAAE